MEQEKRKRGGQPKPAEEQKVQRSIRLLPAQWAKYDAAGGIEWLRALIDRSRPKPPE